MSKTKLKTVWDLTPLLQSDDSKILAKELARVKSEGYKFITKWQKTPNYLTEPKVLATALKEYDAWLTHTGADGQAGYYYHLRRAQDELDPKLKAAEAKVTDTAREMSNGLEFFFNRLAKIPVETQKKFLASNELKPYHHLLADLFKNAKYLLAEGEEKILTLKGAPAYGKWVDLTSNFLTKETRILKGDDGKSKSRSFEEIMSLMSNRKKTIRDQAARAFNEIVATHSTLGEHELNAILDNKKTNDELRHFSRPDASRHLSDGIESETVDAMLAAVEKAFPLARRFYTLKAKALGLKRLAYHERNVPVGKMASNYPYESAVALVQKTFSNLDPEFRAIFDRFLKNGQIDVYSKLGRAGGAFCVDGLITSPTYILLNHNGELRDVLTLAHELGHGINNELMRVSQPAIYFGSSLATAEVASTFMEDFVLETLETETDSENRFALQMAKLNDDISSIFRQVACYRFEQELHKSFREKGYLSKEEIGKIFQKHMASYMGPAVEQSSGAENWWVYWSHIRNFFYVYSYASGLLISKSLQALVREDKKNMAKVKQFLSAGLSAYPQEIFKQIGLDITDQKFWQRGLKEIERLLTETEQLYLDTKPKRA